MTRRAWKGLAVLFTVLLIGVLLVQKNRYWDGFGQEVHLVFTNLEGVIPGDPVKVSGVARGRVLKIDFPDETMLKSRGVEFEEGMTSVPVVVSIGFDFYTYLPVDSEYYGTTTPSGRRWIEFLPGTSDEYVTNGQLLYSQAQDNLTVDFDETLLELRDFQSQVVAVNDLISDPELVQELHDAASNFEYLSQEVNRSTVDLHKKVIGFHNQLIFMRDGIDRSFEGYEQLLDERAETLSKKTSSLVQRSAQMEQMVSEKEQLLQTAIATMTTRLDQLEQRLDQVSHLVSDHPQVKERMILFRQWAAQLEEMATLSEDIHLLTSDEGVQMELRNLSARLRQKSKELREKAYSYEKMLDWLP